MSGRAIAGMWAGPITRAAPGPSFARLWAVLRFTAAPRRGRAFLGLALLAGPIACDHSPAPSGTGSAVTGDAGPAPVASLAVDAASNKSAVASVTRWRGTYHSAPGAPYIPPEWSGVHFVVKDKGEGVGDGDLTLLVDTARGRVQGSLEGPLGPATLDGVAGNGAVTATIRRAHPEDQGFTGTLVGKMTGDRLEGTMSLSEPDVSAVRAVVFQAAPERAAP